MKSNIEKVYSKLPKTELATQKVELKVGDELRGLASQVASARDSVYKDLDYAFTPIRQIEKLVDDIPGKISLLSAIRFKTPASFNGK